MKLKGRGVVGVLPSADDGEFDSSAMDVQTEKNFQKP